MLHDFLTWISESRQYRISPSILTGYEAEFRRQLRAVIARVHHPGLRSELERMLDCPLQDKRGNCHTFTEFIYATLLRNGLHHKYDIEAALQYVIQKMLMDRSELSGEPKISLFGGFSERPDYATGNPLLARFLSYLDGAVKNIRNGKIRRLLNNRQDGTVSIGQGRKKGDEADGISPDEIPGRMDHDADLGEMIEDLTTLLRRKEAASRFPLVPLLRAMLDGMSVNEQRRKFGDKATKAGRQVILQTLEEYARSSGQTYLLHLVQRLSEPREKPTQKKTSERKPALSDQERDYRSIASVIARFERPVGTADLGRYRRRWLEYPPRSRGSAFKNRLEEVLAQMVEDQVLKATRTNQGAYVYSPGPQFKSYSS